MFLGDKRYTVIYTIEYHQKNTDKKSRFQHSEKESGQTVYKAKCHGFYHFIQGPGEQMDQDHNNDKCQCK